MLNLDIIKTIYSFDFTIPAINSEIRKYKNQILNNNAYKIQKWYMRNKIEKDMPILFIDEIPFYQKWYIIRLYMKFYPKEDLKLVPYYVLRENKDLLEKISKIDIYNFWERKGYEISCNDVYLFLKKCNKKEILSGGW